MIPPQVPPDWKRGRCIATLCRNIVQQQWGCDGAKRNQVVIGEAPARGEKPSKEADDDAAEAKPWRGRGGSRPPPAVRRGVRVVDATY